MEEIIPPLPPNSMLRHRIWKFAWVGNGPCKSTLKLGGRGISFFDNAFKFMSDEASLGRFNQPPTLAFAVEAYGEVGIISSIYR